MNIAYRHCDDRVPRLHAALASRIVANGKHGPVMATPN